MNDDWTTVEEVLSGLPSATPEAARYARVRAKCHRKLTRPSFQHVLESAVVGGFCAVYISLVTLMALRSHGLL